MIGHLCDCLLKHHLTKCDENCGRRSGLKVRAVGVGALAADIELCLWVPTHIKLGVTLRWTSISSRGD